MKLSAILALVVLTGCNPSQSKAKQSAQVLPLPRVTAEQALDLLQKGEIITASYYPGSGKIILAEPDDQSVDMAEVIKQSPYWCNDDGNLYLPGEMYPITNPETGTLIGERGFGANCEYVEKTFSKGY